jgi:hypothetical protein
LKISAAPSAVRAVVAVSPNTWSCSASDDASVDGDRPGSGGMLVAEQAGIDGKRVLRVKLTYLFEKTDDTAKKLTIQP